MSIVKSEEMSVEELLQVMIKDITGKYADPNHSAFQKAHKDITSIAQHYQDQGILFACSAVKEMAKKTKAKTKRKLLFEAVNVIQSVYAQAVDNPKIPNTDKES